MVALKLSQKQNTIMVGPISVKFDWKISLWSSKFILFGLTSLTVLNQSRSRVLTNYRFEDYWNRVDYIVGVSDV